MRTAYQKRHSLIAVDLNESLMQFYWSDYPMRLNGCGWNHKAGGIMLSIAWERIMGRMWSYYPGTRRKVLPMESGIDMLDRQSGPRGETQLSWLHEHLR